MRYGGLGLVVGEVGKFSMTASRRLQLAAEGSGAMGIILRRWHRQADAETDAQPTAAMTKWRVTPIPSEPSPVPGLGPSLWKVELLRVRAGERAEFEVEASNEKGFMSVVSRQKAWMKSIAKRAA